MVDDVVDAVIVLFGHCHVDGDGGPPEQPPMQQPVKQGFGALNPMQKKALMPQVNSQGAQPCTAKDVHKGVERATEVGVADDNQLSPQGVALAMDVCHVGCLTCACNKAGSRSAPQTMRPSRHDAVDCCLRLKGHEAKAAVFALVVLGLGQVHVHHIPKAAEVFLDISFSGVLRQLANEDAGPSPAVTTPPSLVGQPDEIVGGQDTHASHVQRVHPPKSSQHIPRQDPPKSSQHSRMHTSMSSAMG